MNAVDRVPKGLLDKIKDIPCPVCHLQKFAFEPTEILPHESDAEGNPQQIVIFNCVNCNQKINALVR